MHLHLALELGRDLELIKSIKNPAGEGIVQCENIRFEMLNEG